MGIWWLLLLHPSPWRTGLIALVAAIPVIPLIIAAIATAGGTLATTGRLMRWLPETGPRRALAATTAIAMLCMIIDLTMITMVMVFDAPDDTADDHRLRCKPHPHRLQHHGRATRQPDAN